MNILLLVTGITGLTGRFLLEELRRVGYSGRIRCLVRVQSDVSWIDDKQVELFQGDVSKVVSLREAMSNGVDSIIHLVNIRHSPQVTRACRECGVRRVVYVNTTGVFSKFQSYSSLYKELEGEILESELDYTIIRPTMIYGNERDVNIHKLVKIINRYPVVPVLGRGNGLMQPIYAQDLARAIAAAYVRPVSVRKAYNVAGRHSIRYIDLLRTIARALGKKRKFIHMPYGLALAAGFIGNYIPNGLINLEKVQRLTEDKAFDYEGAARDLDFKPRTFEEGVALEVAALRQAGVISAG